MADADMFEADLARALAASQGDAAADEELQMELALAESRSATEALADEAAAAVLGGGQGGLEELLVQQAIRHSEAQAQARAPNT